jgi:hypothetical protein
LLLSRHLPDVLFDIEHPRGVVQFFTDVFTHALQLTTTDTLCRGGLVIDHSPGQFMSQLIVASFVEPDLEVLALNTFQQLGGKSARLLRYYFPKLDNQPRV